MRWRVLGVFGVSSAAVVGVVWHRRGQESGGEEGDRGAGSEA